MRILATMAAATLVGALGVPAQTPGFAAEAPHGSTPEAESSCKVAPPPDQPLGADGLHDYERWLASPQGQQANTTLNDFLATRFPATEGAGDLSTVSQGLIGVTPEFPTQTMVLVVDPSTVDVPTLQRDVDAFMQRQGQAGVFTTSVRPGCNSSATILSVWTSLDLELQAAVKAGAMVTMSVDATDSTVHLVAPPTLQVPTAESPVVTLEDGAVQLRSRVDDGQPHKGGARINNGTSICTSGFALYVPSLGQRTSVTAGHCGAEGHDVQSGNNAYGHYAAKRNNDGFDMMRIQGTNQTYAAQIYTNPGDSSGERDIVGGQNPGMNDYICASGAITLRVCGIRVTDLDYKACYLGNCYYHLIFAKQPGQLVGQGGDSGAPLYDYFGSNGAGIRGTETGGTAPDNLFGQKTSQLENQLNGTVATAN